MHACGVPRACLPGGELCWLERARCLLAQPRARAPTAAPPVPHPAVPLARPSFGPCRDALWRTLFCQPLLNGPGLLIVTLLALGGAVAAAGAPLWRLLLLLGGTTGPLLALVLPGCARLAGRGAARASAAALLVVGVALMGAAALRAALYPLPA